MADLRQFSTVTKNYLARFYDILCQMIQGMTNAKLTDSISYNFIVQMIPHHRAAIEMSRNILQYTTFVPLQPISLRNRRKALQIWRPCFAAAACLKIPIKSFACMHAAFIKSQKQCLLP